VVYHKLHHIDSISDGGNATKVHDKVCKEHAQIKAKLIFILDLFIIIDLDQNAQKHLNGDNEKRLKEVVGLV
jgi:hypothetical protein